jgi:hypothetical protein
VFVSSPVLAADAVAVVPAFPVAVLPSLPELPELTSESIPMPAMTLLFVLEELPELLLVPVALLPVLLPVPELLLVPVVLLPVLELLLPVPEAGSDPIPIPVITVLPATLNGLNVVVSKLIRSPWITGLILSTVPSA